MVYFFNLGLVSFFLHQQCELYHWVDLLDRFDGILCDAGQTVENMSWLLVCDRPDNGQLKALLLAVLNFTALLIEYSFSRHLYSSIEVSKFIYYFPSTWLPQRKNLYRNVSFFTHLFFYSI